MTAIFKKELKAYFTSAVGYVFLGFMLIISGVFFIWLNVYNLYSDMTLFFSNISIVLLFLVPILTMRLISEEKKTKTDQLLITSPVSITEIVLGKYLASLQLFMIAILIMCIYPIIIAIFGKLDFQAVFLLYLGYFLMGASLISIGLFVSAQTDNQIIACIVTFAILLIIWLINIFTIQNQAVLTVVEWLSVLKRYEEMTQNGTLDIASIVYFVSVSGVFVYLTVMSLERKRWS